MKNNSVSTSKKNLLAFLFGLGSITQTRVVGAMGLTEFFCIFIAPFVLARMWPRMRLTRVRPMLILMGFWFASALVTDLVFRRTPIYDMSRGCTAILFLGAMLICAYGLLHDDIMRVRWAALGTAISSIIAIYVFQPQVLIFRAYSFNVDVNEIMSFKTYFSGVWAHVARACAALLFDRMPVLVVFVMISVSALSLLEGARSSFLFGLIGSIGAFFARYMLHIFQRFQQNIVLAMLAALLLGWVAQTIYAGAANSGKMGAEERAKYEKQSQSRIGLLAGRAEFIASLAAIKDSPLLGHGSWALDHMGYRLRIIEAIGDAAGLESYRDQIYSGRGISYIPAHSHLWQAWVWHGVAGGVFWTAVLIWLIRYLRHGIHLCRPLIAYNLMVTISYIWALLFSPFSNRPGWGVLLAVVAVTMNEVDARRSLRQRGIVINTDTPWGVKMFQEHRHGRFTP